MTIPRGRTGGVGGAALHSVEYCHVTPENSWEEQIDRANTFAELFLRGYGPQEAQKCIMIDDVHADAAPDTAFLEAIIARLRVKPDSIYLESSFIPLAQQVLDALDPASVTLVESPERTWLRSLRDRYDSRNEFAVKWTGEKGVSFACPTLAATSYLVRLGALPAVPVFWGEPLRAAGLAVQLLSSIYLPVETNAQLIIKAFDKRLLSRLAWSFF